MGLSKDYHTSKTLSVSDYEEIIKSADFSGMHKHRKGSADGCEKAWGELQQVIIDIVGLNDNYQKYLGHKIAEMGYIKEALIDGHEYKLVFARMEAIDAAEVFMGSTGSQDFTDTLLDLSKMQGYRMRADDTTVYEYFKLIKKYNKDGNR